MCRRCWSGWASNRMNAIAAIHFDPLIPWLLLAVLGAVALVLVGFGLLRRAGGIWWRALAFGIALLALGNPILIEEERQERPDIAAIVVDDSASQSIGNRREMADRAAAELKAKLEKLPNLDVRVVRAGQADANPAIGVADGGTRLFDTLARALSDVPRERVAGAILITDGQVHDVPTDAAAKQIGGPVHTLLTGAPNERDRRLVVEQAPAFGVVGTEQTIIVKVEDTGAPAGSTARVTMKIHDGDVRTELVPTGQSHKLSFKLTHGGPTIVEMEVDAAPQELTLLNNHAVVVMNGVRDRLRVLLVTGEPHAGERVWRNLLKADPSVDLVHFTILRPPEKQDGTPIRELSLIAFPIRELFEVRLNQFDLVIFDRYRRLDILPPNYFENIANYVRKGGALLEAAGPSYATGFSLARSPLGAVLPARPTGQTINQPFQARLTPLGRRHPVTADLPGAGEPDGNPSWGRWFRLSEADPGDAVSLMSGASDKPVLLLGRVGEGRVAQLLSDQSWLWARGFEGGGPQAELLRRLAHWLMKEPDLEEDDLRAVAKGNRLEITRRSLQPDPRPVTVTKPDGSTATVTLDEVGDGRAIGALVVNEPGVYRATDGQRSTIAAIGTLNPKEFADVRATPVVLQPVADATGGAIRWLTDGLPDIRRPTPGRETRGGGWIGLVAHHDYLVTGVTQIPLLPALAILVLLVGGLLLGWRREAR